jgi:hypothetical protein
MFSSPDVSLVSPGVSKLKKDMEIFEMQESMLGLLHAQEYKSDGLIETKKDNIVCSL